MTRYLVERAKGFCSKTDWMRAYIEIRAFEADLTKHGIVVVKFWLLINVAFGLFFGKQVGIYGLCWVAIKLKIARLPMGMSWGSLYGTAALCGICFTMSLFIRSLVFQEADLKQLFNERLGIILDSLASGFLGYFVLRTTLRSPNHVI